MALSPMLRRGSTADLLLYATRDPFGAEAVQQLETDFTGFNELCRWTRDFEDTWSQEHFLGRGKHNTLKIARTSLVFRWNGQAVAGSYKLQLRGSHTQDPDGNSLIGAAVATASRTGTGTIRVSLGDAIADGGTYYAFCCTEAVPALTNPTAAAVRARAWIYNIVDDSTFDVVRKAWTPLTFSAAANADGDFALHLFHEKF